jgi:hypothetical protein
MPDTFDTAYELSTWRGLPVRLLTARVSDLRDALPDFALRAFGEPPHENPRMRCVVRMPTAEDPYERPVAAVSDQYELIQHQVLATWLVNNLREVGVRDAEAAIAMSEYGERVRITIPLDGQSLDLNGDLFNPDQYRPEIEVVNSVDRSLALGISLRWRRMICLNGMFVAQEDRLRSIHRSDLFRTELVQKFMTQRLASSSIVMSDLQRWKKRRVDPAKIKTWVEGWLREKSGWTVENCARLLAILESGYDGAVTRPPASSEKQPLSSYRVGQHRKVPGVVFPVETAYDVAQLLTWITSKQRSVEMQLDGTEDVPRLMRALLKI